MIQEGWFYAWRLNDGDGEKPRQLRPPQIAIPERCDRRCHNGLEVRGSHDPFVHVVLQSGNFVLEFDLEPGDIRFELSLNRSDIGFELGLNSRDLGLKDRQIRLGGEIVVGGFAQGFGERLGLLGREPAFVPQRAEEATRIEQNTGHRRTIGTRSVKSPPMSMSEENNLSLAYRVTPEHGGIVRRATAVLRGSAPVTAKVKSFSMGLLSSKRLKI